MSKGGKKSTCSRPLQKHVPLEITVTKEGCEQSWPQTRGSRIPRRAALEGQVTRRLRKKFY